MRFFAESLGSVALETYALANQWKITADKVLLDLYYLEFFRVVLNNIHLEEIKCMVVVVVPWYPLL